MYKNIQELKIFGFLDPIQTEFNDKMDRFFFFLSNLRR